MKKCPSCNSYNDDLNAICEYCGVQFPDVLGENSYNENDNQGIYDNSEQNSYNDQSIYDNSEQNSYNDQSIYDNSEQNSYNDQSIYDNSGQNSYNNQSNYNNSRQNSYNNQNNFDMSNYRTTEEDKAGMEALVFGILSFFCCAIIFGPLAIMRSNESRSGLGTAGRVLGIVGMCLWALGFLLRLFS